MVTIDDIPLFNQIEPTQRDKLKRIFTEKNKKKGDELLTYSEEVDGLYLIIEGEVDVRLPHVQNSIAILGAGSYFGEMSLLEASKTASATVDIHSATAKLLFCKRQVLERLLNEDVDFAQSFYQSAALTLSNRLRHTNQLINTEINSGMSEINLVMHETGLASKLQQTKADLEQTGITIVKNLLQAYPNKQAIPLSNELVIEDLKKLYDVLLKESQKFDRLSQQLDSIMQHLENIKRVANGIEPLEVAGDESLFDADR